METMTDQEFEENKKLITAILQTINAGGCYISGDMFFTLAFANNTALKKIARELNIKTGG